MSACENGRKWEQAPSLVPERLNFTLKPDDISYNTAICACETGKRGEPALSVLSQMRPSNFELNVISYDASARIERVQCFIILITSPCVAHKDSVEYRESGLPRERSGGTTRLIFCARRSTQVHITNKPCPAMSHESYGL